MTFNKDFRSNPERGVFSHRLLTFVCEAKNLDLAEVWALVSDKSLDQLKKLHRRHKRRNDPVASVKKARSAYSYFTSSQRASIVKSNPKAGFGDVSKLISEKWRKMSERSKRKYQKLSVADKLRYTNEVAEARRRAGLPVESTRPHVKKPLTAFFFYQKEVRSQIKNDEPALKPPEVAKRASQLWKGLSNTQKKKYEKLAVADRKRYQKQKAAVEAEVAAAAAGGAAAPAVEAVAAK